MNLGARAPCPNVDPPLLECREQPDTVQTAMCEHAESVLDALRYVEPAKLGVYQQRQAAVKLRMSLTTRAAAFNTRCRPSIAICDHSCL